MSSPRSESEPWRPPYGESYPPYHGFAPGYGSPIPYSDKTKAAAGLLQLLPGLLVALGGIGRCYTGHVGLGVAHIVLSVIGWVTAPFLIGIPIVIACWLWALIDGIVLLAGNSVDAMGGPLR
jgi:TM2 domain-containing membrane protein YozV